MKVAKDIGVQAAKSSGTGFVRASAEVIAAQARVAKSAIGKALKSAAKRAVKFAGKTIFVFGSGYLAYQQSIIASYGDAATWSSYDELNDIPTAEQVQKIKDKYINDLNNILQNDNAEVLEELLSCLDENLGLRVAIKTMGGAQYPVYINLSTSDIENLTKNAIDKNAVGCLKFIIDNARYLLRPKVSFSRFNRYDTPNGQAKSSNDTIFMHALNAYSELYKKREILEDYKDTAYQDRAPVGVKEWFGSFAGSYQEKVKVTKQKVKKKGIKESELLEIKGVLEALVKSPNYNFVWQESHGSSPVDGLVYGTNLADKDQIDKSFWEHLIGCEFSKVELKNYDRTLEKNKPSERTTGVPYHSSGGVKYWLKENKDKATDYVSEKAGEVYDYVAGKAKGAYGSATKEASGFAESVKGKATEALESAHDYAVRDKDGLRDDLKKAGSDLLAGKGFEDAGALVGLAPRSDYYKAGKEKERRALLDKTRIDYENSEKLKKYKELEAQVNNDNQNIEKLEENYQKEKSDFDNKYSWNYSPWDRKNVENLKKELEEAKVSPEYLKAKKELEEFKANNVLLLRDSKILPKQALVVKGGQVTPKVIIPVVDTPVEKAGDPEVTTTKTKAPVIKLTAPEVKTEPAKEAGKSQLVGLAAEQVPVKTLAVSPSKTKDAKIARLQAEYKQAKAEYSAGLGWTGHAKNIDQLRAKRDVTWAALKEAKSS